MNPFTKTGKTPRLGVKSFSVEDVKASNKRFYRNGYCHSCFRTMNLRHFNIYKSHKSFFRWFYLIF